MKKMVFVVAVILFMAIMMCSVFRDGDENRISLELVLGATEEKIRCHQGKDEWFVFLPSFAQLNDAYFSISNDQKITLNDIRISDGMKCDMFDVDIPYSLCYTSEGEIIESRLTFLRSENVASMHIDTSLKNIAYIHKNKGNKDTGTARMYTAQGALEYHGDIASINGRGNATWTDFEKKPYSLELSQEADLLGMGKARKWILIANAADPSLIRNKLALDFANDLGMQYSPQSGWIDLYINNEYMGLYLLCERNEVEERRVDISKEDGVLVSLERLDRLVLQNYPHIQTDSGSALRIHYPQILSSDVLSAVSEKFRYLENVILSDDKKDLLSETIDMDSWTRKYLIEEIFLSCDAGCLSQYFYYEGNEKVYAGPVWDFDYSLGNYISWQCKNPDGFYAKRSWATNTLFTPWFAALYENELFYEMICKLYNESCLELIDKMIHSGIREEAERIEKAAYLNNVRWNIPLTKDYPGEIIAFLSERKEFLSSVWIDGKQYHQVRMDPGFSDFFGYFSVEDGGYLAQTPELKNMFDHQFEGWFHEETNEPFDISKPIREDVNLYAAWSKPNKVKQLLDKCDILIPVACILIIGAYLLLADIRRMRKGG